MNMNDVLVDLSLNESEMLQVRLISLMLTRSRSITSKTMASATRGIPNVVYVVEHTRPNSAASVA